MIRRLYVHNFRCLENFELPISGLSSALLIGKNGAGKTTVGLALEILQKIGRGTNRVGELVKPKDRTAGRLAAPVRFEIEVELDANLHAYSVAFELPAEFEELRVLSESLTVAGKPIFTRDLALVNLARTGQDREASFSIDWHLVALPIIQEQSMQDPLFIFKRWLSRMLILRPMPGLIFGESKEKILEPNVQVTNFGAWFAGVLAHAPSAYTRIDEYLKPVLPDLKDIKNPLVGTATRSLVVQFHTMKFSAFLCSKSGFLRKRAPVAQLDRASGYEPEGRMFESCRSNHLNQIESVD